VSGTIEESYLRRPISKTEAKPGPEGEKTGSDVAKVTTTPPREAVKSEAPLQRRPVRGTDSDQRDEPKNDNTTNTK
jgi:hypothetical protein